MAALLPEDSKNITAELDGSTFVIQLDVWPASWRFIATRYAPNVRRPQRRPLMLCMNNYKQDYIDECRSRMEAQLAVYRELVATTSVKTGRGEEVDAFEPLFFGNLVVVLDGFFVHRARALEKKDGNALNEVCMICNSLLQNRGVLSADKTIKYDPEKSVVKMRIGHEIKLTESVFCCPLPRVLC
jgi:hypothetical protein